MIGHAVGVAVPADFAARASCLFKHAQELVEEDCQQIAADHSAKGLLRSGATAKRAIGSFKERMSCALEQALSEAAKRVEHRGRAWVAAMEAISQALEEAILAAPQLLGPTFQLARASEGNAAKAVGALLDDVAGRLREQLDAFREGWTAPRPKKWSERYPFVYAVFLLLIGSAVFLLLIGSMVGALVAHLFS
jgi:hypothetical protein